MTPYADANFFANLLLELPHSRDAVALAEESESRGDPPMAGLSHAPHGSDERPSTPRL
jgi:hypothetical protein